VHVVRVLSVSERRACKTLKHCRATHRYVAKVPHDEEKLNHRITTLASEYGRYGYRRITALLHREGWEVNVKRVYRIWRAEGLKVPKKQPKRARLWFADGSSIRKRPEHPNHVWSYDFVMDRTRDGRPMKMLNVIDEYTRECLAIEVKRKMTSKDVLSCLGELFLKRGCPATLTSWFETLDVKPLFIHPGSPWENGYCESFNGKFRDEFLNGEIFYTLKEAQILAEQWRRKYNTVRPHSSLGYKPPAPEALEYIPRISNVTRVTQHVV
jgi:putative transposase